MVEKFATEKVKYIPTDYAIYGRAGHIAKYAFDNGVRGTHDDVFSVYDIIYVGDCDLELELCKAGLHLYMDVPNWNTRSKARDIIKMWTRKENKLNDRREIK